MYKSQMKEWFRKLRYKLAYWIAPDWIDDLEYRLSGLLCEATGSRWSKPYYPLDTMISQVNDYQQDRCDECDYYRETKYGKWHESYSYDCWHYDCPFCEDGYAMQIKDENPPNYCSNCGAKMGGKVQKDGEQE